VVNGYLLTIFFYASLYLQNCCPLSSGISVRVGLEYSITALKRNKESNKWLREHELVFKLAVTFLWGAACGACSQILT
jgi:hypothetical protein